MVRIRTFVAIEVPGPIRRDLAKLTRKLDPFANNVRWVEPENMHITLVFLGDVEDRRVHDVCSAVEKACSDFEGFPLEVGGLGVFPKPEKPRVICAKIKTGTEELAELREEVASTLDEAQFQFDWKFSPHITVGRVGRGRFEDEGLVKKLQEFQELEFSEFHVYEVVVNSSILEKKGPAYVRLSAASLDG